MSILITVLGLGLLIAAHEAGHLLLARLMGMRVETYSLGFGPRLAGFTRNGTDYRLSAIPFGGYCRIAGFSSEDGSGLDPNDPGSYLNKPAWRRALVIAAGPGVNYVCAFLLLAVLYAAVGYSDPTTNYIEVIPGGAAAAAGMQTGDRITSIDGEHVSQYGDLLRLLPRSGAPEVRHIEVDRGGRDLSLDVHPINGRISVQPQRRPVKVPFGQALARAIGGVNGMVGDTFAGFAALFSGKGGTSLAGPIGIVKQVSGEVKRGAADFTAALAALSVALAVFNFLPIPALDGGRIVFLVYEIVTGRRPPEKLESVLTFAGVLLLLALLLGVTLFGDLGLGRKLFGAH